MAFILQRLLHYLRQQRAAVSFFNAVLDIGDFNKNTLGLTL
jgi:hypothetical protein